MNKKIDYGIQEVLSNIRPFVSRKDSRVEFDGDVVPMNSNRYLLFAIKGVTCVECEFKATFFRKTWGSPKSNPHFTPYGIDKNGNEIMMTRDHIIPKSRGGSDDVENAQPMCIKCNEAKGNTFDERLIRLAKEKFNLTNDDISEAECGDNLEILEKLVDIVYDETNEVDVEEFVEEYYNQLKGEVNDEKVTNDAYVNNYNVVGGM